MEKNQKFYYTEYIINDGTYLSFFFFNISITLLPPQEGLMVKQSLVNKYKRSARQFLKRWIGRWSNREKNKK